MWYYQGQNYYWISYEYNLQGSICQDRSHRNEVFIFYDPGCKQLCWGGLCSLVFRMKCGSEKFSILMLLTHTKYAPVMLVECNTWGAIGKTFKIQCLWGFFSYTQGKFLKVDKQSCCCFKSLWSPTLTALAHAKQISDSENSSTLPIISSDIEWPFWDQDWLEHHFPFSAFLPASPFDGKLNPYDFLVSTLGCVEPLWGILFSLVL